MHRNAGGRKVVVPHRFHAHEGEEPAERGEFLGRAYADRAMALHIEPAQLAATSQAGCFIRARGERRLVDPRNQVAQGAVLRHLGAIQVGHGPRE